MSELKIKGGLVEDFITFIEDEKLKPKSPYESVTLTETTRNYGDGKKAAIGDVLLLSVAISADLIKDLCIDFVRDKMKQKNHSVSYTFKNQSGDELVVNLNKLSFAELEKLINEFHGNITEVTDCANN